jgi:DNA-binding CsgD family transcriptional regulator
MIKARPFIIATTRKCDYKWNAGWPSGSSAARSPRTEFQYTSWRRAMAGVATREQRTASPENYRRTHEELLDDLIRQIAIQADSTSECATITAEQSGNEEVIIDISVNGTRYLMVRMPQASTALVSLSPREQEIAHRVARGCSNKAIATSLNISQWTVGTHIRHIYAKFGVASRAAMVARLLEVGGRRARRSNTTTTMSRAQMSDPIDALPRRRETLTEERKDRPRRHHQRSEPITTYSEGEI